MKNRKNIEPKDKTNVTLHKTRPKINISKTWCMKLQNIDPRVLIKGELVVRIRRANSQKNSTQELDANVVDINPDDFEVIEVSDDERQEDEDDTTENVSTRSVPIHTRADTQSRGTEAMHVDEEESESVEVIEISDDEAQANEHDTRTSRSVGEIRTHTDVQSDKDIRKSGDANASKKVVSTQTVEQSDAMEVIEISDDEVSNNGDHIEENASKKSVSTQTVEQSDGVEAIGNSSNKIQENTSHTKKNASCQAVSTQTVEQSSDVEIIEISDDEVDENGDNINEKSSTEAVSTQTVEQSGGMEVIEISDDEEQENGEENASTQVVPTQTGEQSRGVNGTVGTNTSVQPDLMRTNEQQSDSAENLINDEESLESRARANARKLAEWRAKYSGVYDKREGVCFLQEFFGTDRDLIEDSEDDELEETLVIEDVKLENCDLLDFSRDLLREEAAIELDRSRSMFALLNSAT